MPNKHYDAAMLYSGGLDSGATLHYLHNAGVNLERLLLLHGNYGQTNYVGESNAIEGMCQWYSQTKNVNINTATMSLPLYNTMGAAVGAPMTNLIRDCPGNDKPQPFNVPWRNYLLILCGMAYCEQGEIPKLYVTMGYSTGDIWDNTPSAYVDLKYFLEKIEKVKAADDPNYTQVSLESPALGVDRHEWVRNQIKLGLPHRRTWSCWFYKGYPDVKPKYLYEGYLPCGDCKACSDRDRLMKKLDLEDGFDLGVSL